MRRRRREPGGHHHVALDPLGQAPLGARIDQPVGDHRQHRVVQHLGATLGADRGEPRVETQPSPHRVDRGDRPDRRRGLGGELVGGQPTARSACAAGRRRCGPARRWRRSAPASPRRNRTRCPTLPPSRTASTNDRYSYSCCPASPVSSSRTHQRLWQIAALKWWICCPYTQRRNGLTRQNHQVTDSRPHVKHANPPNSGLGGLRPICLTGRPPVGRRVGRRPDSSLGRRPPRLMAASTSTVLDVRGGPAAHHRRRDRTCKQSGRGRGRTGADDRSDGLAVQTADLREPDSKRHPRDAQHGSCRRVPASPWRSVRHSDRRPP